MGKRARTTNNIGEKNDLCKYGIAPDRSDKTLTVNKLSMMIVATTIPLSVSRNK